MELAAVTFLLQASAGSHWLLSTQIEIRERMKALQSVAEMTSFSLWFSTARVVPAGLKQTESALCGIASCCDLPSPYRTSNGPLMPPSALNAVDAAAASFET